MSFTLHRDFQRRLLALGAAGAFLGAVACSGSTAGIGGGDTAASMVPPECPQPTGGYELTYDKQGGSCADLPPRVFFFDAPDTTESCVTSYQHATATGTGCTLEQKSTCTNGSMMLSTVESVVLQIPTNLQQITGTATVDAQSTDGTNKTCTGTYKLSYVKQ